MWLSGIFGHGARSLIFPVGKHYKVTIIWHGHKLIPTLIWPSMLQGCITLTTISRVFQEVERSILHRVKPQIYQFLLVACMRDWYHRTRNGWFNFRIMCQSEMWRGGTVPQWGTTMKSPSVYTVRSQYSFWYDFNCCEDDKPQSENKSDFSQTSLNRPTTGPILTGPFS